MLSKPSISVSSSKKAENIQIEPKHEIDPSLANYRRSLIPEQALIFENEKPQIEVKKMNIYEDRKLIQSLPIQKNTELSFALEQQKVFNVEVQFYVRKAMVYGLTLSNSIYKSIIRLNKQDYKQGTFAPSSNIQTASFSIKTPGGMLGRGNFRGQACIKDKFSKLYYELEYKVEIISAN